MRWPVGARSGARGCVVIYENVKANRVPEIVTLGIFLIGFPYYHYFIRPHSTERWTLPDPADEELA